MSQQDSPYKRISDEQMMAEAFHHMEIMAKGRTYQPPKKVSVDDWYYPNITTTDLLQKIEELREEEPMPSLLQFCNRFATDPQEYRKQIFQIWTKEYLDGLSKMIKKHFPKAKVLEVGAGNGELTDQLKSRGIDIIATDDGRWLLHKKHPVVDMDYREAIESYKPDLVIASWIPMGEDWTPTMRKNKANYILIGEAWGCCAKDSAFENKRGYQRIDKFDFDEYNICRTDYYYGDITGINKHSQTILFKRNDYGR